MFVISIVCFCGRYFVWKLYGILLYMISISILNDNEDKPDDYHVYYYINTDNEAVLWAALRCCVLYGSWIWSGKRRRRGGGRRGRLNELNGWRFKKRFPFSPAELSLLLLWRTPLPRGSCVTTGTSEQAVIRWQHMSLLHVHNLDAYM